MLPRVTPRCLLVGEAIQSAHVSLVELLLVLCLKVVADVSDVEACASALHLLSMATVVALLNSSISIDVSRIGI